MIDTLSQSNMSIIFCYEGCLMDEAMVNVRASVKYRKYDDQDRASFSEKMIITESYEREHKTLEVGLKLGGAFKLFSGSLGLHFKKTVDTASGRAHGEHTKEGVYQQFKRGFYQVHRTIETTVTINDKSASLEEEKYVDSMPTDYFPKNEDWKNLFENKSISYVKEHFDAPDDEIVLDGDGAVFEQAFCLLGKP